MLTRFNAMTMILATGLALVGCYNPSIKDGGFVCTLNDPAGCPDGYTCVSGVCENMPAAVTAQDLLASTTGGDASSQPSGGNDLAGGNTAADFSIPAAKPDMSVAPADLASAPPDDMRKAKAPDLSCGGHYAPCTTDADCCSEWVCSVNGKGCVLFTL